MTTDYRAELQRLVKAYDDHGENWPEEDVEALRQAVERARTALDQPETEEEWYPRFADWLEREMPEGTVIGDPLRWASKIADYLACWGRPAVEPETNGKA